MGPRNFLFDYESLDSKGGLEIRTSFLVTTILPPQQNNNPNFTSLYPQYSAHFY